MWHIFETYRSSGFDVIPLTVCAEETLEEAGEDDRCVSFPAHHPLRKWRGLDVPLIADLLAGRFAAEDDRAFARIVRALPARPDFVQFEHPWLWPLVKRLRSLAAYSQTRFVYSSHNIEAPLKQATLRSWQHPAADAVATEIDALEREAAAGSDQVIAVSRHDTTILSSWTCAPVLLAPNGIAPWSASPDSLAQWRARVPPQPFALFVASAHPPNVSGFIQCLGDMLGFLPPDGRVVVAGSVSEPLLEAVRKTRFASLMESRLQTLGVLDDSDLSAVRTLAHVFLLPLTEGSGSSIKAAEALISERHVVGPPVGFRSFESYSDLSGVQVVAPDKSVFVDALKRALCAPPVVRDEAETARVAKLQWTSTLAELPHVIARLASA